MLKGPELQQAMNSVLGGNDVLSARVAGNGIDLLGNRPGLDVNAPTQTGPALNSGLDI